MTQAKNDRAVSPTSRTQDPFLKAKDPFTGFFESLPLPRLFEAFDVGSELSPAEDVDRYAPEPLDPRVGVVLVRATGAPSSDRLTSLPLQWYRLWYLL